MTALQRSLAITRCFATADVEVRLIHEMAEILQYHPGMRFDPRDEDTAFAKLFHSERPANPGFNLRLEFILKWIVDRKDANLQTVARAVPFTVDWGLDQGFLVGQDARTLVERHCAAGVGEWTVSQEYQDGIMLCSGYARHSIRADTVGMEWRRESPGERHGHWHAAA